MWGAVSSAAPQRKLYGPVLQKLNQDAQITECSMGQWRTVAAEGRNHSWWPLGRCHQAWAGARRGPEGREGPQDSPAMAQRPPQPTFPQRPTSFPFFSHLLSRELGDSLFELSFLTGLRL